MKHLITEKQGSFVVYIDANTITKLCNIADLIEDSFPQSVIEVTHNRNTCQGSIILNKQSSEIIDKIKEIIEQ